MQTQSPVCMREVPRVRGAGHLRKCWNMPPLGKPRVQGAGPGSARESGVQDEKEHSGKESWSHYGTVWQYI